MTFKTVACSLGARLCINEHLSTAKQSDSLAGLSVLDNSIPDLGCLAKMHGRRSAFDCSLTRSAQMIGLEFDGSESGCALRQIGYTSIAGGCVRECDHTSGVKEAIGGP